MVFFFAAADKFSTSSSGYILPLVQFYPYLVSANLIHHKRGKFIDSRKSVFSIMWRFLLSVSLVYLASDLHYHDSTSSSSSYDFTSSRTASSTLAQWRMHALGDVAVSVTSPTSFCSAHWDRSLSNQLCCHHCPSFFNTCRRLAVVVVHYGSP